MPDPSTLDPRIPAPASVLGHPVGDAAARYSDMERYLHTLADASPLVTLTPYASSHEGRALYYLTITSEANHARLADIKADNAKLADPRRLDGAAEADRIIDKLPAIAWLAYAIHGDELSGTDAALLLAYQLAAGTDERSRRIRDELIVLIDPLQNPDGRERYLEQLEHLTGRVPNSDYQAMQHRGLWSAGRGNHYLFDLNRDWLMQVHPETRGRAEQILTWNPHLLVDAHEMGPLDTYLFDPPREPLNIDLSDRNLEWRRTFSADQARAFDRHGWSYYTREWYEEWYPGYTNGWANLLGAVGILYEQAGVNAAAIRQEAGWTLTYRDAVHRQLVSSLANLGSLLQHRGEVVSDFYKDRIWAVGPDDAAERVFLLPPPPDRSRLERFVDLLGRHGIESGVAKGPVEAQNLVDVWGGRSASMPFPAGTLVVSTSQPHRRLLRAVLGFDPPMTKEFLTEERKHLERIRETRIYDITAWNLAMAYGLEAYWGEQITDVALLPSEPAPPHRQALPIDRPAYGYLIDGRDSDIYRAVVRLLDGDCKVRVALKPFRFGGRAFPSGSALLRLYENPDDLSRRLSDIASDLAVEITLAETALSEEGPDLGGQTFRLLQPPRVAIASQWPVSTTSFGATWHLLDVRGELRASPINVQSLGLIDLRRYNVLVLPSAYRAKALAGALDERVREKLKAWVEAGGTLIALGDSAAFLAEECAGLTDVRLRRHVLDQLDVYTDQVARERSARTVAVEPAELWKRSVPEPGDPERAAPTPQPSVEPGKKEPDVEKLKRDDEWARRFSPVGCFVAAVLDSEHWLAFGLSDRLPVFVAGEYAFMSKSPVHTPVRLESADRLRLSGLLWHEARHRLADSAYATVERKGDGQVILFASDPFARGYLEGTGRLYLNALVYGPGLGTSPQVPW